MDVPEYGRVLDTKDKYNMKIVKNKWSAAAACGLAVAGFGAQAHAQSSDALIDKLVGKGILTVKEANDLKEETDKDFTKAYSIKSGLPEWVTSFKFNGDFRGRFEENNAVDSLYHARDRYRYRVRLQATATMWDDIEVGLRLASGNFQTESGGTLVGGQPITANTDLNSLGSRKPIWVDAAYAKWTPIHTGDWTLTAIIGKMDNPFALSNMIWDYDIDPEGGALQAVYNINDKHTLKFNGAIFVLDELNQSPPPGSPFPAAALKQGADPYVFGGQLLLESKWTPKFETSLGIAAFNIANTDSLSAFLQPFYNSGNTRNAATGALINNYNPIIGTGAVTYKLDRFPLYGEGFPIKFSGEYMENPGAPMNNVGYRVGVTLGKAGKKGLWEVNYRYQRLEADAWFDALVDDDNGAFYTTGHPLLAGTGKANGWFGGTNVRGHLVQATYNFTDFWNFTFTYYLNELIINAPAAKSDSGHFMADMMWKF